MRKSRGSHFRTHSPSRRSLIAVAGVLGALLPVVLFAAAPSANAVIPSGIGFTQEGCDNPGGLVLPNGSGDFVCPTADYGTGNMGKNWSELDLVPLRVTVSASNSAAASSTFSFAIAVDNTSGGNVGYDVLSAATLNTALSAASCSAAVSGSQVTANGQLLRLVTVTVSKSTNCVYDYYARLAIGAHNYPGSSLHANLADDLTGSTSGIGTKAVSINPREVAPQSIDKDMSATQDSDHIWNVTKSPTPASLSFTNTCDPNGALSQPVAIQVSWTKQAASPSGVVTVITHVYATNPSTRTVTVSVSDQIYSGLTAIGSATTAGPTDIPANTANFLMLTHTTTVPAGTANLNDIATATYTDKVTGVAIPGTTTATASATVQSSGTVLNAAATINDVESITGTGLSFSVDGFTGASGAFDAGYVAGTHTTGPVSWTSASQTSSGSVTLNKTVYASAATVDSSGGLSDTATLTGVDGFTTDADLTVDVDTDAATSLAVTKDSTLALAAQKIYTFHLFDDATDVATGDVTTVTLPAGSTGPVTSAAITGLSPTGSYYVKEDASAPFGAQTSGAVTFALVSGDASTCSADIEVTNSADPATARVQKTTAPSSSGNWTFTLTGPNGLSETLNNVVANAGYASFASALDVDGGTYTITETQQTGYDLTGVAGDIGGDSVRVSTSTVTKTCSFTLDLAGDSGDTLSCTFTNTKRGTIIVKKVTNPAASAGSFTFTGDAAGSIAAGGTITVSNLVPGTYTSSESDPTPAFDLTGISCDDGASTTPSTTAGSTATFKLDPGETITCTFTNTKRGTIIVKKATVPVGAAGSFGFTGDASGSIGDGGTITVNNLVPGTYTSAETDPTPTFDLTAISCNDSASANVSSGVVGTRTATFKLDPGETVTCTFTNTRRPGHVRVVKTVSGHGLSGGQSYTFQLRSGASAGAAGTILETLTVNAGTLNGTLNFATNLVAGTTYQLCEQMQAGWMTSLGPPIFSVYNPSGDNSVVCTDFTVTAGQLKIFNIDNTPPPGGLALTIGYWKNWSSCSGGKQKPILDQKLLAAANAGSPITLGLLVLNPTTLGAATACRYAVAILSKSTITRGTKKASDPLFNMAAQLLAADLNVVSGAGTCAASTSAITAGHALLAKYNFDGDTYSPKLTNADANLGNQLGATLDKYNNNKLC
ncbi:MAG: trimeric autotransporter adhesin [Pseudonocardiales bacterium]|nr:trimeric autotransporter adhesin [Pseudonocardiales bacterium]